MMRNQPHMTLKNSSASEIALEIPANDPSVAGLTSCLRSVKLDLSKPGQLTQAWVSFEAGKPKPPAVFVFAKK